MFLLSLVLLPSCMKWDYDNESENFNVSGNGLFIICEGNFQYGNSTLTYYDPATEQVENEVFYRVNGMRLGDVAQSMTIFGNKGWICVNNSHVVFAIDINSFRETGRVENLTSPRYIHFVNDEKAYVSQIWDNRIFIINPKTYSVTGYITVPDMPVGTGSTEQMVQIGKYVYCNCWSYQNRIIRIDSETDKVTGSLTIGIQPNSLVADRYGRLWTITDGGYEGSPYGYEAPAIYCIDTQSFATEKIFNLNQGDTPSEISINPEGSTLYWINEDIWKMDVDATTLPAHPFIPSIDTKYYGLTVSPDDNEIYVADAIDYSQQGMIYRFSEEGFLMDKFYVGVTPGAFCWKKSFSK